MEIKKADIKKYNLYLERTNVVGNNILIKENDYVVGWYNLESTISFLKENYKDKIANVVISGFNNLEKKELMNNLESLLKENKSFLLRFTR